LDVVWAGTFVPDFERNKRLAEYLAAGDLQVRRVHADLWPEDRVGAFESRRLTLILKMLWTYPVLAMRLFFTKRPDVYLVSYPGWFDVPIVWVVAALKRRPVVFDVFISLHDTAVRDRELVDSSSLVGRLARLVDRVALRVSDRVIADCPAHARFLASMADVDIEKFGILYLGADEATFQPLPTRGNRSDHLILFYGTFVPLQGVDVIVEAAAQLCDLDLKFELVGTGQTWDSALEQASNLELGNVDFPGRLSQPDLAMRMTESTLCLGIFGTTDKADRVIPHKVYEALACARPVLTGQTSAIGEAFGQEEVLTSAPGDPHALAAAIRSAVEDPGRLEHLAQAGRSRFEADFSMGPQSRRLAEELAKAI
jgi:glycosyltransferase involved in cell wall biosynthesis